MDEEWCKFAGDLSQSQVPDMWVGRTCGKQSGNGSVKMRVRPRGRQGAECLVALLVQFDEVAMQTVQKDTVCAASDKADSC